MPKSIVRHAIKKYFKKWRNESQATRTENCVQFRMSEVQIYVFKEHNDVDDDLIHQNKFICEREQIHLQRKCCSADKYWRRYYLPKRQKTIKFVQIIVEDFIDDLLKQIPDPDTDCSIGSDDGYSTSEHFDSDTDEEKV